MAFLTLADAKQHLRVDGDADDGEITDLIDEAIAEIERECGWVCVQREGDVFVFDRFEPAFVIPRTPVDPDSVVVGYLDAAGVARTIEHVRVYEQRDWTYVTPPVGASWPTAAVVPGAVTITATVGLTDSPIRAATDLRAAAKLILTARYDDRAAVDMPAAVAVLLDRRRRRQV